MTDHLSAVPSRSFWLNELRVPEYEQAVALMRDVPSLRRLVETSTDGLIGTRDGGIDAATENEPATLAHVVLVASFLRQKKTAALVDVAESVMERGAGRGRLARLPLGWNLYQKDPWHLVDVEVCHRWHSHRRCALALVGPRRVFPRPAAEIDWDGVAAIALEHARSVHPLLGAALSWRRHVLRADRTEVLLAWIEPGEVDTVRTSDGAVAAGVHDGWTILRIHREGNRIDLTATELEVARALADGVAKALWNAGEYKLAREPLSNDLVQEFLARLVDPDDDAFQLLEVVGEVPGLPGRPVFTVSNAGRTRVEACVLELQRHVAFARDWRTVHRVKLAFDDCHRIEVHFPVAGEDLVLTYSDLDRDKAVAIAFERLLRDELGIEVHPKVQGTRRRPERKHAAPKHLSVAHWERLLSSVIDAPEPWELDAIDGLAREGVLAATRLTWFRCADASSTRGKPDTLDCPGVIEMPYGVHDAKDPVRQPEDATFTCSHCGTRWEPGRYRLPCGVRVRVVVEPAGAWRWLLRQLPEVVAEEPGVAGGYLRGRRAQVVFLPLAPIEPWHLAEVAALHAVCWVSVPDDPRLARYADRGVSLAAVLAEGILAIRRVLELGRANRAPDASVFLVAEPQPSPWSLTAPNAPPVTPDRHVLSLDPKGIWLDGEHIAAARANGIRVLVALLDAAACADVAAGTERRFWSLTRLARLGDISDVAENEFHQWVSRARKAIRSKFPNRGLESIVIENDPTGYRLGPSAIATGFDLSGELTKRQARGVLPE